MEHDPERLELIDANSIQIRMTQILMFSPDTLTPPELKSSLSSDILEKIHKEKNIIKKVPPILIYQELNVTSDSNLLNKNNLGLPLWEGKNIWNYDWQFSYPRRWIAYDIANEFFKRKYGTGSNSGTHKYRLCFRGVAAATNERSLIAAIVPRNIACEVKCTCVDYHDESCRPNTLLSLLLLLNSFVLDFTLRFRVTCNVNIYHIEQLPIPSSLLETANFLIARAARLSCSSDQLSDIWSDVFDKQWINPDLWTFNNSIAQSYGPIHEQEIRHRLAEEAANLTPEWTPACGVHDRTPDRRDTGDRAQLRAEIDAYVAHLYGLTRDEFAYILDTFPVLKRKEEQAFGEFMSKRKCLEEYDRIGHSL